MSTTRVVIVALVLSALPTCLHAQVIQNGSFEQGLAIGPPDNFLTYQPNATGLTGWSITAGSIDCVGARFVAADGLRCIDLNGTPPNNGGGVQQIVSTRAGARYEVRFQLGGNPENLPRIKHMQVFVDSAASEVYAFDTNGRSTSNIGWVPRAHPFTASRTSTIVELRSVTQATAFGPLIDSVEVVMTCGSGDFNGDGDFGTDQDIEAFFACLGGSCCASCGSGDFNMDGDDWNDSDIEAFFRVLSGGTC